MPSLFGRENRKLAGALGETQNLRNSWESGRGSRPPELPGLQRAAVPAPFVNWIRGTFLGASRKGGFPLPPMSLTTLQVPDLLGWLGPLRGPHLAPPASVPRLQDSHLGSSAAPERPSAAVERGVPELARSGPRRARSYFPARRPGAGSLGAKEPTAPKDWKLESLRCGTEHSRSGGRRGAGALVNWLRRSPRASAELSPLAKTSRLWIQTHGPVSGVLRGVRPRLEVTWMLDPSLNVQVLCPFLVREPSTRRLPPRPARSSLSLPAPLRFVELPPLLAVSPTWAFAWGRPPQSSALHSRNFHLSLSLCIHLPLPSHLSCLNLGFL